MKFLDCGHRIKFELSQVGLQAPIPHTSIFVEDRKKQKSNFLIICPLMSNLRLFFVHCFKDPMFCQEQYRPRQEQCS